MANSIFLVMKSQKGSQNFSNGKKSKIYTSSTQYANVYVLLVFACYVYTTCKWRQKSAQYRGGGGISPPPPRKWRPPPGNLYGNNLNLTALLAFRTTTSIGKFGYFIRPSYDWCLIASSDVWLKAGLMYFYVLFLTLWLFACQFSDSRTFVPFGHSRICNIPCAAVTSDQVFKITQSKAVRLPNLKKSLG